MHQFGCANDGIHRAGLYAFGTANAVSFDDPGDGVLADGIWLGIKWQRLSAKQFSQSINSLLATRRASIDCFTKSNGLGIGATSGVATLATLCLWEFLVNALNERVRFGLKAVACDMQKPGTEACDDAQSKHAKANRCQPTHRRIIPAKPMNASAMKPAVINAMAAPSKGAGISANASRSRTPANSTRTSENPAAAPIP